MSHRVCAQAGHALTIDMTKPCPYCRVAELEEQVADLHRIGSLDELKAIAADCAKHDYCSTQPFEMSYCVTQRFVEQLAAAERDAARYKAALEKTCLRWPATSNPNCDDYERGYATAIAHVAFDAREALRPHAGGEGDRNG